MIATRAGLWHPAPMLRIFTRAVILLGLLGALGCSRGEIPSIPDAGEVDDVLEGLDLGLDPRCGSSRAPCCGGRACNRTLACEEGLCCGLAGASCSSQLDCCGLYGCNDGRCCVDVGGLCETSADCCAGGLCRDGLCERGNECGAVGQRCCVGDLCASGGACSSGICVACGQADGPCCDGRCGAGL
nr:hypothetical protein [Deltaproteobacteria bacterium]